MVIKKKEAFLFIVLVLFGLFFLYIYNYIKQTQKNIFNGIEKDKIENVAYILNNIKNNIFKNYSIENANDLVSIFAIEKFRKEYENKLSLLITPDMKYVYLLHKDNKNKFRFLLDASKTDRARFYQKFDVYNSKYQKIYKTKLPQIIRQNDMENLYITYLHPIIKKNKVIAILSVDITTNIQKNILKLIKPLETFFVILIIFISLLIIMTVFQIFYYLVTRRKIFTDSLTSLFNRNYLKEISPSLNLQDYSVAMLDLDRFKSINDNYGHKTGDFVLSKSSEIIKKSIRNNDILIRYGGEEFLLLVYTRNKSDSLFNICERIRKNISEHIFNYDSHEIKMRISMGVHENPALEKNITEAIKIADKMLYIAKRKGRNRVVYHNENSKNNISSKDIDFTKQAIEDNRIICYYQPIYNPKTNKILKYEALVRIIDMDGNIIAPIFFLSQLKDTNIHYKLTQRILSIIVEKFKNNNHSVSINVNFSDLINEDIENAIKEAFINNPDLASRVTFEILESDEIDNLELFKEKIKILHSLGVKVSIDDFGSGYSNFRAVLDIEANYLKIDGSLIKNIDTNEKDFKVVKSIINFAKEANMQTIAEFVHSKDVYNKLLEIEIDYMQGYYIAMPCADLIDNKSLFK